MIRSAVAVAATAVVAMTTLSGAAALPGTVAPPSTSTAASTAHTRHFVLHQTGSHGVGRYRFVGTDKIKSKSSGEVVGFDSYTGKYDPTAQTAVLDVALSLKGGIIVGRVALGFHTEHFAGRILKGSGKYQGVEGTITGRDVPRSKKTYVTIQYLS